MTRREVELRDQEQWRAIRAHGESVVHFGPCRGCGEPIFVAWADTNGSLRWVAFDRNADEVIPDETYVVTKRAMRKVRPASKKKPTPQGPAYWEHDCINPLVGGKTTAVPMD